MTIKPRFIAFVFILCLVDSVCAQGIHPVYFKLFSPGTLYGDAVKQAVFCDSTDIGDDNVLLLNHAINRHIILAFVNHPWLFTTTQTAITQQTDVVVPEPQANEEKTKDLAPTPEPPKMVLADEDVQLDIVAHRPNFWKFDGNGSLQFQQNHFSENWYQGGTDNYTMLLWIRLHAKYDNKQKLQWETTLDTKLGFQTVDNDDYRKMRTNNDQLRLTTKLGYRASKHWYYTIQGEANTQFCKQYTANTPNVISDFASPLKTVISIGMDYKLEKKKFNGSAVLAPLAMTWMYVDRPDLATRFGNDPDTRSNVTWGPNVTINATWRPFQDFSWTTRIHYFSNFEYANVEWENTLTFKFNKYISSKLFFYPRFNDSSTKFRAENGSYFMFKEWFSLGLDYSF